MHCKSSEHQLDSQIIAGGNLVFIVIILGTFSKLVNFIQILYKTFNLCIL
jgi:hypothetical protein